MWFPHFEIIHLRSSPRFAVLESLYPGKQTLNCTEQQNIFFKQPPLNDAINVPVPGTVSGMSPPLSSRTPFEPISLTQRPIECTMPARGVSLTVTLILSKISLVPSPIHRGKGGVDRWKEDSFDFKRILCERPCHVSLDSFHLSVRFSYLNREDLGRLSWIHGWMDFTQPS